MFEKQDELEYEKNLKEMEEKAIEQSVSVSMEELQNQINGQHNNSNIQYNKQAQNQQNANSVPEYNDPDYMPPQDGDMYIPPEEMGEMPGDIVNEEVEETYIMGKKSRAKEKLIKIKDITANDGRATLEGRILTCECRETKSGKGMIIFELYDGTGVMTCKSFAKRHQRRK